MKTYAITIKPESSFGTPLKGDTLFGQFCWQVVHQPSLLHGGLDTWIDQYPHRPFAVFSSAWPQLTENDGTISYCLPRPTVPATFPGGMDRKQRVEERKKNKKKKWLVVKKNRLKKKLASSPLIDDKELFDRYFQSLGSEERRALRFASHDQQKPIITSTQAHNSINRLTLTTGKGFDPFNVDNFHFLPGLELVIFVALDEEALDLENLQEGLKRIGQFGFGRDASTGLGRFSLGQTDEVNWPLPTLDQACYTLAPCVPNADHIAGQFAVPFTRFGRHGDQLVLTGKPFKNPIIMAEEGAVFFPAPDHLPVTPYIGQAVTGLSQVEERTVAQGFSLYLPLPRSLS